MSKLKYFSENKVSAIRGKTDWIVNMIQKKRTDRWKLTLCFTKRQQVAKEEEVAKDRFLNNSKINLQNSYPGLRGTT